MNSEQANGKFEGDKICRTPVLDDFIIKYGFVSALSELLGNRKQLISDCNEIIIDLTDNTKIDDELAKAENERDEICILLDAALTSFSREKEVSKKKR